MKARIFSKTFFYSWIVISCIMFALSYVWHGVILNDFMLVKYPFNVFLSLAVIVYLAIGAMMSTIYSILEVEQGYVKKGVIVGASCGLLIYAIGFLFGISFAGEFNIQQVGLDLCWQIFEQALAGLLLGVVYEQVTIFERRWAA